MDTKELNRKIDALGKRNASVEAEIQEVGIECLVHLSHGNNGPVNRLVSVLRRGQHKPFVEWVMAFGQGVKNTDKVTKESQPIVYDKTRATDLEAATVQPWFMFADAKATATAKAFDFQAAMMHLLKKAAANGVDHDTLVKAAALAAIAPEKVPATVTVPAVGAALV